MIIAEITRVNNVYGRKCFEADVQDGKSQHHIQVFLDELLEHGIKATLNCDKMAERWLNATEDGQRYLGQKIGRKPMGHKPVTKFGRGRTGGVA